MRMEEIMPLLHERIEAGQQVRFMPMGTSMLPMLHPGRDSVTLTGLSTGLCKYDVALYQRENGNYVLHRIVRTGDVYTCVGDNQFVLERVLPQQMIAKVVAFTHNGRDYSVNATKYRIYCRLWHWTRPLRRVLRSLRIRLGRIFA